MWKLDIIQIIKEIMNCIFDKKLTNEGQSSSGNVDMETTESVKLIKVISYNFTSFCLLCLKFWKFILALFLRSY